MLDAGSFYCRQPLQSKHLEPVDLNPSLDNPSIIQNKLLDQIFLKTTHMLVIFHNILKFILTLY